MKIVSNRMGQNIEGSVLLRKAFQPQGDKATPFWEIAGIAGWQRSRNTVYCAIRQKHSEHVNGERES
ncbi:MAG: hypothetical protein D6820_02720 [Lentisphaerae bacterium]|nr:MAG: hypothetical protein D6820_02720 [Lentisphaerota bacterium]